MKPLSNARRLTVGLGVIALGVCAALPFLRPPPRGMAPAEPAAESHLALGEDVSLQLPGQSAAADYQPRMLRPWPEEDMVKVGPKAVRSAPKLEPLKQPPALPDQYRPLFKPGAVGRDASRQLGELRSNSTPPSAPLKRHTIHDGDTLESLAVRYLGDARRAIEILEANRQVLSDPDLLPIGVEISIPRATPGTKSAEASVARDTPKLVPLPTEGFRRGR